MDQLLPQLIVIVAAATIIIIVLHRIPDVTVAEGEDATSPPTKRSVPESGGIKLRRMWQWLVAGLRFLLRYAAEAKDRTVRAHYLERFAKVLDFKRLPNPFHPPAISIITKNQLQAATHLAATSASEAEQAFLRIIERDPSNRQAYEQLGQLYAEQKKFKEASEAYGYLTAHYPKDDSYFSKLGIARFHLADYPEALAAFSRAFELRPERSARLVNISLCYEALGEIDNAVEIIRRAIALEPDQPRYLMILADLLIAKNDPAAAEVLHRLLELEPTNEAAREKLMELKF